MGAAVVLCSSATSGRGLTSVQVAAALRATVTAQLQRYAAQQQQSSAAAAAAAPATTTTAAAAPAVAGTTHNNNDDGCYHGAEEPLRRTRSGLVEGYHRLNEASYTEEVTYDVAVDAPRTTATATKATATAASSVNKKTTTASTVRVTEYAPRVFHFLRQACCVDEELFADEWTLSHEQLQLTMGEGRSQALFIKSRRMLFMCKTIAVDEVHVLLRILRAYVEHVSTHVNSLLMRFYMLLRLDVVGEDNGSVGEPSYLLCSADVYSGARKLNEKWDIKGRVPKPGKYRFFTRPQPHPLASSSSSSGTALLPSVRWPLLHRGRRRHRHKGHGSNYYCYPQRGQEVSSSNDSDDSDSDDDALRQPELVVTPVNAARRVVPATASDTEHAPPQPLAPPPQQQQQQQQQRGAHATPATVVRRVVPTRHDKDLTRLFWLDKPTRDRLVTQLTDDYAFLARVHLMDYSLLVGVSYNNTKLSRSGHPYVLLYNFDEGSEVDGGGNGNGGGSGGGVTGLRAHSHHNVNSSDHGANEAAAASDGGGGGNGSHLSATEAAELVVLEELRPEVSYRVLPRSGGGGGGGGGGARHQLLSEFAEGVHSLHDQEVYYIGVIDILTKYNIKKKTANFCKSFLWEERTLSTVPPAHYRKRIVRYTKIIFPEVT